MALASISLCTGYGGLDLAVDLVLGTRVVGYVERESYAQATLLARMEAKAVDRAPIWSDLRTFDGRRFRGCVDLVTAGYPCQPYSLAGKRQGDRDERDLWPDVRRIIDETDAPLAFLENVSGHLGLGFDRTLRDLAALGFDAEWLCLRASDVGAPHRRDRLFVLAYRDDAGRELVRGGGLLDGEREAFGHDADGCDEAMGDSERARAHALAARSRSRNPDREPSIAMGDASCEGRKIGSPAERELLAAAWPPGPYGDWSGVDRRLWPALPQSEFRRVAHGPAERLERLRLLGNGVVPFQAAAALEELARRVVSTAPRDAVLRSR